MTQVTNNTVAAAGQTVSVPMPDSGAQTAIVSSAGGVLDLAFDPGAATVSRVSGQTFLNYWPILCHGTGRFFPA